MSVLYLKYNVNSELINSFMLHSMSGVREFIKSWNSRPTDSWMFMRVMLIP
jgi:hypothetical protein